MNSHVVVLNSWFDDRVCYPCYLDHRAHRVSYLTTPDTERHLRAALGGAPATVLATDLANVDAVLAGVDELERRHGPVARVVALSEDELMVAARVRERLGLPGTRPDLAVRSRDKVLMKELVARAGVPVPRYVRADDRQAVRSLTEEVGFPIVVKPRSEAASVGVEIVRSAAELERVLSVRQTGQFECEEYLDGQMFHADGLVAAGSVRFFQTFQYVNNPILFFKHRTPSGAVMVDDRALVAVARSLAERVVAALDMRDDAFHLEFFVLPSGEPRFLEIGARIGGGPIRRLLLDTRGVDVARQHVRLQLQEGLEVGGVPGPAAIGGYLMIPEPAAVPCRVTAVACPVATLQTLYSCRMPEVGMVLDGSTHYLNLCGLLLFRGATTVDVLRDVRAALASCAFEHEPVAPRG